LRLKKGKIMMISVEQVAQGWLDQLAGSDAIVLLEIEERLGTIDIEEVDSYC
jgi:hypothetical protein